EARLALGVDLAAIEGFALVRLAQDFIGSVQLGKARGCPRVVLVGVRMQLLRLPAERTFDLGGTRCLRHPQDVIGVTHPQSLSGPAALVTSGPAPTIPAQCGGQGPRAARGAPTRTGRSAAIRRAPLRRTAGVLLWRPGCGRQRGKQVLRPNA